MKFREEEALRYLGAKGAPDEQTSALLRDAAAQLDAIATPSHAVLRVRAELSGTRVTLGAFQADCVALAAHLAGCGAAYLFAATLGAEVDRAMARLAKLDVARAFALQACAASALECFCDDTCAALAQECAAEGLYLRPRISPGYSGFSVAHRARIGDADGLYAGIGFYGFLQQFPQKFNAHTVHLPLLPGENGASDIGYENGNTLLQVFTLKQHKRKKHGSPAVLEPAGGTAAVGCAVGKLGRFSGRQHVHQDIVAGGSA